MRMKKPRKIEGKSLENKLPAYSSNLQTLEYSTPCKWQP